MEANLNRIMLFFLGLVVFIAVFGFLNTDGWDKNAAEEDKGKFQQITEMVEIQNESRSPKY